MSLVQDRLVLVAILLSESAWLYGVFGVLGLMFAGGGSPLSWLAVLAVMGASMLVARVLRLIIMPATAAYAVQMVCGVIVLYLTIGTQVALGGLDLGWIGKLASRANPEGYTFRAALGSIMGVGLWWRGGGLATADEPVESLKTSFKLGIIALAIAAAVDIYHSADLNIFPIMFVFFATGLGGLSFGHLLPASRRSMEQGAWPRVIGGTVAAVVVMGLLFSLLQRDALAWLAGPLLVILNGLATVIFFVFIVPMAFIADLLTRGLFSLFRWLAGGQQNQQQLDLGNGFLESLNRMREGQEQGPVAAALLHALEWTLLALIILAALFLLASAFRRRLRWRRVDDDTIHESVKEGADPAQDLARLLSNLLPSWLKGGKPRRAFRLPDDDADVVDVFRIYFGLLALAEDKGIPRPPSETPEEYQRTLETVFPAELVRKATAAFNRACYGHHPAPRQQIEEMKASIEQLSAG